MLAAVGGPDPREAVVAERDRVGRLVRARELILGAQDGLFLPLAVVTGLASANVAKTAVVVAGIAEAAAGAIAKATEALLATRAEDELYDLEIAKELREIDARSGVEVNELADLLHDEGVPQAAARASATAIATSSGWADGVGFGSWAGVRETGWSNRGSNRSCAPRDDPRVEGVRCGGRGVRTASGAAGSAPRRGLHGPAVDRRVQVCFRRSPSCWSCAGDFLSTCWRSLRV